MISLLVGGMATLLLLNTASAANELDRHALAQREAVVAAKVQQLHYEVAASAAPANLSRAAQLLGMVPAGNPAFLMVGADGSVTRRGSASPVEAEAVPIPPAAHKKRDKSKKESAKKSDKSKKKADKKSANKSDKSKKKSDKKSDKKSAKESAKKSDKSKKSSHGGHR